MWVVYSCMLHCHQPADCAGQSRLNNKRRVSRKIQRSRVDRRQGNARAVPSGASSSLHLVNRSATMVLGEVRLPHALSCCARFRQAEAAARRGFARGHLRARRSQGTDLARQLHKRVT
eukprot:6186586-Pleurochrysis_carterae.AAC.1